MIPEPTPYNTKDPKAQEQLRDINQESRIKKLEDRVQALETTAGADEILKLRKWCERLQERVEEAFSQASGNESAEMRTKKRWWPW